MNIKLVRMKEEHLALVMNWRMRPDITKYMNTDPQLTLEMQKKWYTSLQTDETQRYWVVVLEENPIGVLYLMKIDKINQSCHWGYYIAEQEARSLKLAIYLEWNLYDYVFDVLHLHKLCDDTFVENEQVVALHKYCGSKQDGILRDHVFKNGEFHDVSTCSILSDEWKEKRKTIEYEKFMFE